MQVLRTSSDDQGRQLAAAEINSLHRELCLELRANLAKAIRIGELLAAQKQLCMHGTWLAWCEANLEFGRMQVSRYMRCFRKHEKSNVTSKLHLDSVSNAGLTIEEFARESAAEDEPEEEPEPPARPTVVVAAPDPRPFERAAAALKETPDETNAAIARRIGVSEFTVRRMRNGSDGRTRKRKVVAAKPAAPPLSPTEAARRQEMVERSQRSIPWPEDADAKPVHPDGEIRTRQLRDAVVRLSKAEPLIGKMTLGSALAEVFSDTKKIHFANLDYPGAIAPALKKWAGDVNLKAVARDTILTESRRRRWDAEADAQSKRYERSRHKIHGFGAGWARFEKALKAALKKSVFSLEDAQALKDATAKYLEAHFEALRQKGRKT